MEKLHGITLIATDSSIPIEYMVQGSQTNTNVGTRLGLQFIIHIFMFVFDVCFDIQYMCMEHG